MNTKKRANISLAIILICSIIAAVFAYLMSDMFASGANDPEKNKLLQSINQSNNIEEIRAIANSLHSSANEMILLMSDSYNFIMEAAIIFILVCVVALFKINRGNDSN